MARITITRIDADALERHLRETATDMDTAIRRSDAITRHLMWTARAMMRQNVQGAAPMDLTLWERRN